MPDNYSRRRGERIFAERAGVSSKRQRLEHGREQAELGVSQRERAREAQRMIQAKEAEDLKRSREALLDPDKFIKRKGVSYPKDEMLIPEDAILDFEGEFDFLAPQYSSLVRDIYDIEYPSLEHAFQAQKISGDRRCILTMTWREAKSFGAKSLIKKKDEFHARAESIMRALVRDKFLRNEKLQLRLCATKGRRLIFENDFRDSYWGFCREKKQGKNLLGSILEEVRDQLIHGRRHYLLKAWLKDRAATTPQTWTAAWRRSDQDNTVITIHDQAFFCLGRSDADIILDHPSCSRAHAALFYAREQAYLVDLGSVQGSFFRHDDDWSSLKPLQPHALSERTDFRFGQSSKRWRFKRVTKEAKTTKQLYQRLLEETETIPAAGVDGTPLDALKKRTVGAIVTNLSYDATEADLRRSDLLKDIPFLKLEMQRGKALIDLASDRDLLQVLACDGDEIKGRRVRVKRR